MRIGLDVTALPTPPFGAGNYIVNLTQALVRTDSANHYFVFAKSPQAELFAGFKSAQVVRTHLPWRLYRIAWEQTLFPLLTQHLQLDVVHSPHYTMPLLSHCAHVVTFHDMTFFLYPEDHLLYKKAFFRSMMPFSARRADALIAISNNTKADMLRLFPINPAKIYTVPYGIAPFFCPMPQQAQEAVLAKYQLPTPFVLYVGKLEPRKNLPVLLRAFDALVQRGLPHALVLAGSRGWMDESIFATMRELGLEHRVFMPGYVPQAELPALYSASSAFVYPSRYEGFGLPVLEAMACGTPVITSNTSSMPEIAGGAAILVAPDEDKEIASAIERILREDSLRVRMQRDGLARAQEFSWERAAQETTGVYQRAMQARTSSY